MKIKFSSIVCAAFYPVVWLCIFINEVGKELPPQPPHNTLRWIDVVSLLVLVVPTAAIAFFAGRQSKEEDK